MTAMNIEPASVAVHRAADEALALRDEALAALDGGDPQAALAIAGAGLETLMVAGMGGGPDAAALLAARAEVEHSAGRFGDATATVAAAITLLDDVLAEGGDDYSLSLWCQAQERLADLERLAGGIRCCGGPAWCRAAPGFGGVR